MTRDPYRTRLDYRWWMPPPRDAMADLFAPMLRAVKAGIWGDLSNPVNNAIAHATLMAYDRNTILATGGFDD